MGKRKRTENSGGNYGVAEQGDYTIAAPGTYPNGRNPTVVPLQDQVYIDACGAKRRFTMLAYVQQPQPQHLPAQALDGIHPLSGGPDDAARGGADGVISEVSDQFVVKCHSGESPRKKLKYFPRFFDASPQGAACGADDARAQAPAAVLPAAGSGAD